MTRVRLLARYDALLQGDPHHHVGGAARRRRVAGVDRRAVARHLPPRLPARRRPHVSSRAPSASSRTCGSTCAAPRTAWPRCSRSAPVRSPTAAWFRHRRAASTSTTCRSPTATASSCTGSPWPRHRVSSSWCTARPARASRRSPASRPASILPDVGAGAPRRPSARRARPIRAPARDPRRHRGAAAARRVAARQPAPRRLGRDRGPRARRARCARQAPTRSSTRWTAGSTDWSVTAASPCPAVSASASRSHARSSPDLACSCSTTRSRR